MAKQTLEINPAGLKLSKKSPTPLYLQLYGQFRQMILSKRFRAGERVPASRNLAKELGVSRIIVSQAFEQLIMEGYLVGKPGSGTFVVQVLPDQLLHVKTKNGQKINESTRRDGPASSTERKIKTRYFQIGTPSLDSFPYKTWSNVAANVLKDLKKINLGYGDTLGYWPLRKAIASYLRISRAVTCEAEQIIVVTGSQQGLNLITQCLLKKNDKVWMEDPCYFGARDAFEGMGVEICGIPVDKDGLDIDYARKKFPKAGMVYVTPSHQFPLGYTLSQQKRWQLLEWAQQNESWILEDDYDSEFRYEGNPLPSLQGLDENKRVIYSGTFSKVLFPGLRLAYIVLPSVEMVNDFKKVKEIFDRQSPIMEQLILYRFMEEGFFLRHIRKMRLLYAERQQIIVKLLNEQLSDYIRLNVPPSGMHVIGWLSEKINLSSFGQEIKKQNLAVSFISEFTLQHTLPPAIALGFTAFTKYQLKTAVEKLRYCVHISLHE